MSFHGQLVLITRPGPCGYRDGRRQASTGIGEGWPSMIQALTSDGAFGAGGQLHAEGRAGDLGSRRRHLGSQARCENARRGHCD